MSKIKETITALMAGDVNAVKVSRKESMPFSEECFKCINRTVSIVAAATVIVNVETSKLIALLVFGIFFLFIHSLTKD